MDFNELPKRWKKMMEKSPITADMFDKLAVFNFEDGSMMVFNHCFVVLKFGEYGIFTEHCGYFVVIEAVVDNLIIK